jgi:hypothetical protein
MTIRCPDPAARRDSPVPASLPAETMSPQRPLPASRHIVVGVSDPSDDPSRHRVFEIRAVYDATAGGWIAGVDEQNANAQPEWWPRWQPGEGRAPASPTAAACLGRAVEIIVDMVAGEASDA